MSASYERIIVGFNKAARKVVNSYFIKRTLMKKSFTPSEMETIKKIDDFLHFIFYTRNLNRKTNMICVCAKYTIKVRGQLFSLFIDKFISFDDLLYKKCDFLIAKGIYLLTQDKRCEVYFSVASFCVLKSEDGGRGKIRRVKKNAIQETVLFLDLDLNDEQNRMGDDALREWVFEKSPLLKSFEKSLLMVRSGHGVHCYLPINAYDVFNYTSKVRYEQTEEKFVRACVTVGADVKAKDMVRVLRIPYSYNRKPSFEKPFFVHPITELKPISEDERLSIFEVDRMLDAYIEEHKDEYNGFVEVTDEAELQALENGGAWHINLAQKSDFKIVPLPSHIIDVSNDDIDTSDRDASSSEENESTSDVVKRTAPMPFYSTKILCENLRSDYVFPESVIMKNLKIAYRAQKDHRLRDIWFYLLNRKSIGFPSQGKRHRLIFMFMYTLHSVGVKSTDAIENETRHLNNLFVDPYSEAEISKEIRENLKTLKIKRVYKSIRNDTLDSLLDFTEQEKKFTLGNYETDKKLHKQMELQHAMRNNILEQTYGDKRCADFKDERAALWVSELQEYFEQTNNNFSYKAYLEGDCDHKILGHDTFKKFKEAYIEAEQLKKMIDFYIPNENDDNYAKSVFIRKMLELKKDIDYITILFICPCIRYILFSYVVKFGIPIF